MTQRAQNTLRSAEKAVTRLVEACRKDGTLYPRNPKATAQVSRTARWLLNALAQLNRELNPPIIDVPATTS